jgi:hypothetical protein
MTQPAAQGPAAAWHPTAPRLPADGGEPAPDGGRGAAPVRDRVVVVTPEGMAVSGHAPGDDGPSPYRAHRAAGEGHAHRQHDQAVARGGAQRSPLDDAGRARLAQIHSRSIAELEQGLAPELVEELRRIALPFAETTPSDAELRIAQAQLVGWLEGLFHGIQTALFAQQMAARAQLEQMRRALPGAPAGRRRRGSSAHDGPVPLTPLRRLLRRARTPSVRACGGGPTIVPAGRRPVPPAARPPAGGRGPRPLRGSATTWRHCSTR